MRRTEQEFKEEVLRRSEAFRRLRSARRKKSAGALVCVCLCIGAVLTAMPSLASSRKEAATESVAAMAAPKFDPSLSAGAGYAADYVLSDSVSAEEPHEEEIAAVKDMCASMGVGCAVADVFGKGGAGATELAETVLASIQPEYEPFEYLYSLDMSVEERMSTIARKIYGADGLVLTKAAQKKLALMAANGLTDLPICMAKTQNSLSDNAGLLGRPTGFTVTVRDFEIANGAGFLVALCGDIMRMPALPKVPAACAIKVDTDGNITGMKG